MASIPHPSQLQLTLLTSGLLLQTTLVPMMMHYGMHASRWEQLPMAKNRRCHQWYRMVQQLFDRHQAVVYKGLPCRPILI